MVLYAASRLAKMRIVRRSIFRYKPTETHPMNPVRLILSVAVVVIAVMLSGCSHLSAPPVGPVRIALVDVGIARLEHRTVDARGHRVGDFLAVGADILHWCAADGARNATQGFDAGAVLSDGSGNEFVPIQH